MRKLISASFARLWRDNIFWALNIGMFGFALYYTSSYVFRLYNISAQDIRPTLDNSFFYFVFIIGLLCAVFAALFLGVEYGDGVIRNKLIVGRRRIEVYLANLLTVFTATLSFMAAWLLGAAAGFPLQGIFNSREFPSSE